MDVIMQCTNVTTVNKYLIQKSSSMSMLKCIQILKETRKLQKEERKKEKINFLLNYYQLEILKKIRVKVENFTFRSGYNNSVLNLYGLG